MKISRHFMNPLWMLAILWISCQSSKKLVPRSAAADPYSGVWDFVVMDTPSGKTEGVMHIQRQGYQYRADVRAEVGEVLIEELTISNERMKGSFHYKGFKVNVKGSFAGNACSGKIGGTFLSYPFTASKR